MSILRIEEVLYGVEDVAVCSRFFEDAGLEQISQSRDHAVFRTPVNQYLRLSSQHDPSLPAPAPKLESGSNIREIIWGVDTDAALEAIGAELTKDRTVARDEDGTLHSCDDSGYGIAFRVARPVSLTVTPRKPNLMTTVGRTNLGVRPYGRAQPLRIIHVALDIPKEGREEANRFYTDRLRFKAIDRVLPMGTFMQCEGDIEHHNFLLCHRPDRLSVNHIAFEVRDFDEVVEGGNYMAQRGWKESRRLGRHNLGSNVFRMFHAPCGGRIEYAADMDRMDKTFSSRTWEQTPQHHLWMVKFPGDSERD